MTTVVTVRAPQPADESAAGAPRYTVGITGSGVRDGCLCLLYAVTPVPPPLRIGPAGWHGNGHLRVLFPPFADTPGFAEVLCEAHVVIDATRVRSTSIRGL